MKTTFKIYRFLRRRTNIASRRECFRKARELSLMVKEENDKFAERLAEIVESKTLVEKCRDLPPLLLTFAGPHLETAKKALNQEERCLRAKHERNLALVAVSADVWTDWNRV